MVGTRLNRVEERKKSFQKMVGVALEKVSSGHEATHKGPPRSDRRQYFDNAPAIDALGWRGRI